VPLKFDQRATSGIRAIGSPPLVYIKKKKKGDFSIYRRGCKTEEVENHCLRRSHGLSPFNFLIKIYLMLFNNQTLPANSSHSLSNQTFLLDFL
jgi:hypothetical protein